MKKVVVTGGGGFVGKALVHALRAKGIEVAVIGRRPYPDLVAAGVICHQGDIRNIDDLKQAFNGADTVFHVAAKAGIWGRRQEYLAINVEGTANVLRVCREKGITRLVYTSTPSVVFSQQDICGADESLPYAEKALCHYAASKIIAEQLVLRANGQDLATTAIRPHLVWGPGDPHLIPRLIERGRAKALKQVGDGSNWVDIAYIDNVVHAHLLAAENLAAGGEAAGKAFFIGQEQPVQLWAWINQLFTRVGVAPVQERVSFTKACRLAAVLEKIYCLFPADKEPPMTRFLAHQLAQSHWFSHALAKDVLGYEEQVSTAEGMEKMLVWLQSKSEPLEG